MSIALLLGFAAAVSGQTSIQRIHPSPESAPSQQPVLQGFEDGGPALAMTFLTNRLLFTWSLVDGADHSLQSTADLIAPFINPYYWNWTYTTQITNTVTKTISTEVINPASTGPFRPEQYFRLARRPTAFTQYAMQNDVPDPQRMGWSVAASHDVMVAGAPGAEGQMAPDLVSPTINPYFWNWTYTAQVTNTVAKTISTEVLNPAITSQVRPEQYYRLRLRPTAFQQNTLQNEFPAKQRMGWSVAASHDVMVAGAPGADGERGEVIMFGRDDPYSLNWYELGRSHSKFADQTNDRMGTAVANEGNWRYLSAPGAPGRSGHVYTYERTDLAFILLRDTYDPGDAVDTDLGASLAQHFRVVFIGEPGARRTGESKTVARGQVRVYDSAQKKLLSIVQGPADIADTPTSRFGHSVAASEDGEFLLVGAPGAFSDANTTIAGGAAFLYQREADGEWSQPTLLTPPNVKSGDRCGTSVAISRYHLAIGCPGRDVAGNDSGAVAIFRRDPIRGWTFVITLTANGAASGDQFGFSVALSGNLLVVGAPFDDTSSGADSGSYSVYFRNETASGVGTWQLRWKTDLLPSNQLAPGAHMGWSVAAQGHLIGGGAPLQKGEQGKLFLGLDYIPALFFP